MMNNIKEIDDFIKGHYDHRTWRYEIPVHEWDSFILGLMAKIIISNTPKPNIHYDTSSTIPNVRFLFKNDSVSSSVKPIENDIRQQYNLE